MTIGNNLSGDIYYQLEALLKEITLRVTNSKCR